MPARVIFDLPQGKFDATAKGMARTMSRALIGSLRATAKSITAEARQDIRAGGFTSRFQRAFTATLFPRQINAATPPANLNVRIRSRLGFIAVFENGATIQGKPFLWIPLPGVPAKIGGQRNTPKLFEKTVGKLDYVRRPGAAPLLVGPAAGVRGPKVGLAALRRGQSGGKGVQHVPIFVGVKQIHLRARTHINRIIREQVALIDDRFDALLREPD